ncbi:hypothetical protein [Candidatus Methanoperedens nitratireducens]|nr:hypothetical protein [Candidatus Methanoperedens nitroreducens]
MQMKNVELLIFLAVQRYSLLMLLPLMEGNFMTADYLEAAVPLTIISWYYSKTSGNLLPLVIHFDDTTFRELIRKTICCLNWIFDSLKLSGFSGDQISGNKNFYQLERSSFNKYI